MPFPLLPVSGSSHSRSLLRGSQSHCAHLCSPWALAVLGTDISTDDRIALDTKNQRVATGSSCKACFCDLSLASVYMGRMECHGAYPLRYSWLKHLCKASLKTCLSHVFGRCSYLNYHLEILNSSLPRFSIKNKTATKQLGKHTWHDMSHVWPIWLRAGIQYWHSSPRTNRGPKERRDSKNYPKLHPNNNTCTKEEDTEGTQQSSEWRTSLWYYKGKVSPPNCSRNHITPVPGINHHTNLNGVILTCTNRRLEHNISK